MMKAPSWGLWLAASSLCVAQQPAPHGSPSPLTLPQALSLADQFNPQLRAANAQRQGAEAGITTAAAYPNPDINFLTGRQFSLPYINGPGPAGLLQHYSFDQPIDLPRIRRTRVEEATLRRDTTTFAFNEVQLGVRAAVKQAFFDVLRRQGEVELAQENLRLIEDLRRRIQVQVDVGEAARLELTRSESEVAIARTFARSAELRLYTAIATLRALIGTPLPLDVKLAGELSGPKALPPIDDLRRDVLDRHPALAQARAEVRRSEARLRYEKALRLPAPSVRGEYEHQPDLGFFRLGVSIPVPLWNRRQGPIAEAEAAVAFANSLSDLRRLELTAALERAFGLYQVASQQIASFQEGVLRQASAAVQAAEAAYRFGERGIVEVLDAQRVLRSVRQDYLNAQFDLQAALIELERLRVVEMGAPTP